MAISKVGGAFGYLRKSIGSVTYSAPKLGISQTRQQVARSKATEVSNPNTLGQIMQRMKMANAARFFSAYENVVNKGLMSHSFEKIKYGQPSRLYFNQQALKKEDAVFVPKGVDFFVPGEYLVSEGSLLSLPWRKELAAAPSTTLLNLSQPLTAAQVAALANYNVAANDQITVMVAIANNGRYKAGSAYVIVSEGNTWQFSSPDVYLPMVTINVGTDGCFVAPAIGANEEIAGIAVIVSRGKSESNDARSTETMLLVNGYQSLRSPEALQAAIDSYLNGYSVNSLNSDWYLNQGNGQAFNGRVTTSAMVKFEMAGQNDRVHYVFIGEQASDSVDGKIDYTIFTSDGTADGQAYGLGANNTIIPLVFGDDTTPITGTDAQTALEAKKYPTPFAFVKATAEIAAQGGFTLGEA